MSLHCECITQFFACTLTDIVCWVVVKCAAKALISKIGHYFVSWTKICHLHVKRITIAISSSQYLLSLLQKLILVNSVPNIGWLVILVLAIINYSSYLSLGHQQEVITNMEQLWGGLVDGGDYRLVPVNGQMSQRLQQVQGTAAIQTGSGLLCVCVKYGVIKIFKQYTHTEQNCHYVRQSWTIQ